MKEERLIVSLHPHIQGVETVSKMMFITTAALIPAAAVGVYFFGINAIKVIVISVLSAVGFEAGLQKLMKREITINDGSAVLTGLLFALILPPTSPWWMVILGVFVGMLVGKHVYGGLGSNSFNPVCVGWAALKLSFPSYLDISGSILGAVKSEGITALVEDYSYFSEQYGIESLEGIGAKIKVLLKVILAWKPIPGATLVDCVGQVSALAIIIGGIFLIWKRYINWRIPVGFLASIIIFSAIFGSKEYLYPYILVQLLTGSTLLAAFFVATDPVTTPLTGLGNIVFGVLLGLITMIGRLWGSWVEPVWFCILVTNGFTPLIDRLTKPKPFGRVKESA